MQQVSANRGMTQVPLSRRVLEYHILDFNQEGALNWYCTFSSQLWFWHQPHDTIPFFDCQWHCDRSFKMSVKNSLKPPLNNIEFFNF